MDWNDMNAYERVENRLAGEPVDRVPNFDILMAYAAHLIHQPLRAYYLDYRVLVEANLAAHEILNLDIVQAISDPYREAADFGLQVEFPEDSLPVARQPLLINKSDLKTLVAPDPRTGKRMNDRLEAIRSFREKVGGEVPVMGWVEGALAEAADLRGVARLMEDLIEDPQWVEELLEICVQVEIDFAEAQVEAGADIIGLGDAVASQISPRMYRRFALPHEQAIFSAVNEAGAIGRLHICGNTSRIVGDMAKTSARIIDLDWMVDMKRAAALVGEDIALCGNMDPVAVMLQGTPEAVYEATCQCVKDGGERCISAAGCEIPDGSPIENFEAQTRALIECR